MPALNLQIIKRVLFSVIIPVTVAGCGSGSSGTPPQSLPVEESGVCSESALISKRTGGTVSCESPDGIRVVLEIPSGALEASSDVTLDVEPAEKNTGILQSSAGDMLFSETLCRITVKPEELLLLKAATLSITFPGKPEGDRHVIFRENRSGYAEPVKQSGSMGMMTGTVYQFGRYSYCSPTQDEIEQFADRVIRESSSARWQDTMTALDSLLWFASVFSGGGNREKASVCFDSAIVMCRLDAGRFLESLDAMAESELREKGTVNRNSLERYHYLMTLTENSEAVISELEQRMQGF